MKKQNEYPLLNPRFVQSGPSARWLRITLLSKGTDHTLDLVLASFEKLGMGIAITAFLRYRFVQ
jgi:hypothetical protein